MCIQRDEIGGDAQHEDRNQAQGQSDAEVGFALPVETMFSHVFLPGEGEAGNETGRPLACLVLPYQAVIT